MSTIKNQTKTFTKTYTENGRQYKIVATIRHDDSCGNGHNTFSITGEIDELLGAQWREYSGGCIHDEIAKHFPDLAPLIKWHLTSTDGPLHYIANTVFHASDRDCYGRAAGEPSRWEYGVRFGDSPITNAVGKKFWEFLKAKGPGAFTVFEIAHESETFGPKYTFAGYGDKWHECPFDSKIQAIEFAHALEFRKVEFCTIDTEFSKGKPRDLDAARNSAVWPDATDEDLTAPGLPERLAARLPSLLADFRTAVERLGLVY